MSNNEERRLNKSEYFELREKRLKLVYKILYVGVAIWIALLLSITQTALEKTTIPVYSFLLAASSMVIIQIIKYAIMEFRCMKIIGHLSEALMKQTEDRYENIWVSFSLILSLCGIALLPHYMFAEQANEDVFMAIFSVCIGYFSVLSIVKLFKNIFKDKTIKVLDAIGIVIGSAAAYSLCAAACLITSTAMG